MRNPSIERGVSSSGADTSNNTKASNGGITSKKKAPGIEWQFAKNLSGGYIHWECNFCHVVKSGGASRIREHFLGSVQKSMRKCTHPSQQLVAVRIKEHYEKKNRQASIHINLRENTNQNSMESNIGMETHPPSSSTTPTYRVNETSTEGGSASSKFKSNGNNMRARQASLMESFRGTLLEDAQMALAKGIFFSGNAISMVNNEHWKEAWKKIGEFGPGFSAPSYHAMRHDILDKCYEEVKERVNRIIIRNLSITGCTIVCDGWSNVQRRPLINVMVVSPRGETFIKAVDSTGKIKSGGYIADVLSAVIDEIGADNVVQVVMDNAKNCRLAGRIVNQRYPHIYPTGCNTHSMNLVLKDWYTSDDTTWFASIINTCRKVVKFILKRQRVLDIYRSRMSCMLKLPAETRFCTHFYTLESLIRNKDAVIETFSCQLFYDWEADESEARRSKICTMRTTLNKDKWWKSVANAYHVMMPVMYAIRQMDQSVANIGKVWMTWWTVQRSLETPEELKDSLAKPWHMPFSSKQRKILLAHFHRRWASAHSPLHSAAYFLDPEYWNLDLWSNAEVVGDFHKVVNTFYADADTRIKCIKEVGKFRLKEGSFASLFVQNMAKEQPAWKWWMMNAGQTCVNLRPLAMRILSQCAANSSSERNWSTYKFVHNTVRNRLLCDRADKLVYMYCNEKILSCIESEHYEEDMPVWIYDCQSGNAEQYDENDTDNHVNPIYDTEDVATIIEMEKNLDVDLFEIDARLQQRLGPIQTPHESDNDNVSD